ncbi:MAG: lysophospholipid acyltransferase family protein [Eubacterium sp.]|nr:lysophospholipid acyltransferase family protein [Eubacterium sp.]
MLRALLSIIIAVVFLIVTLPVAAVLALIGLFNKDLRERGAHVIIRWIFRVLLKASGTKLTVKGLERIPEDPRVLFVGNHRSIYDILVVYSILPRSTAIVAKDSLKKIPLLNMWMIFVGAFFLDRKDLKAGMQMILDASDRIKNGRPVLIFPEGTRNRGAEDLPLLEFHEGSLRIATKSKAPVVPVSISNTIRILGYHPLALHPCHVIVEFGEPIPTDGMPRSEQKRLGARCREIMSETIEENRKLL